MNRRKDIIRNTLNRKARKELNLGNRMSHMVRLTPDPIITKKERTVGSILSSHLSVSIITFSYFISSKFEVPTTIVSFYFVFFFLIKVSFYFVGCSLSPLKYFFSWDFEVGRTFGCKKAVIHNGTVTKAIKARADCVPEGNSISLHLIIVLFAVIGGLIHLWCWLINS